VTTFIDYRLKENTKVLFLLNIYNLVARDYKVHSLCMCICRKCSKEMLKIYPNSRLITLVDLKTQKKKSRDCKYLKINPVYFFSFFGKLDMLNKYKYDYYK